eukprot:gene4149-14248_t
MKSCSVGMQAKGGGQCIGGTIAGRARSRPRVGCSASLSLAIAAKANAARELARRLELEKQAAQDGNADAMRLAEDASAQDGNADAMRLAEDASVQAAAQAARADALARALRKAESSREELLRLKNENDALKNLLLEVATDKDSIKGRIESITGPAGVGSMLRRFFPSLITPAVVTPAIVTPAIVTPAIVTPAVVTPAIVTPAVVTLAIVTPAVVTPAIVTPAVVTPAIVTPAVVTPAVYLLSIIIMYMGKPPSTEEAEAKALSAALEAMSAASGVKEKPVKAVQAEVEAKVAPDAKKVVGKAVGETAAEVVKAVGVEEEMELPPKEYQPKAMQPKAVQHPPALEPEVEIVVDKKVSVPVIPTAVQLRLLAEQAVNFRQPLFTFPASPVPVGTTVRLLYNRARGPLPPGAQPQLKAGLNKWETIETLPMTKSTELKVNQAEEWWEVELALPEDLFQLDFVVMDLSSKAVDNNNYSDYKMVFSNAPTETEVLQARLAAYEAAEDARLQLLAAENAKLWTNIDQQILNASAEARIGFREKRAAAHLESATAVVAARRVPVTGLNAPTKDGVYSWVKGAPKPGELAYFVYNKGQGALHSAGSARIHLGYDGWMNKAVKVFDLKALSKEETSAQRLGPGWWWGAMLEVPRSAAVLDFVLSNQEQTMWDNNKDKDYHTEEQTMWDNNKDKDYHTEEQTMWDNNKDKDYHTKEQTMWDNNKDKDYHTEEQTMWDNNKDKDYHSEVQEAHSEDELIEAMLASIRAAEAANDQKLEDRAAKAAAKKIRTRATAIQNRRTILHERLYTIPSPPVAGQPCEVFYNPDRTSLRGRPDIFLRCSWNRPAPTPPDPDLRACEQLFSPPPSRPHTQGPAHRPQAQGPASLVLTAKQWRWGITGEVQTQVLEMVPTLPSGIGFYRGVVDVPAIAWGMDMIFSDSTGLTSTFTDNNGGLDYHISVTGTKKGVEPRLKVIHIAVEMAPIAKVGGMGDVVTALGRAVMDEGHQVEVILPKYDVMNYDQIEGLHHKETFKYDNAEVKVWHGLVEELPTTFLEPSNGHFWAGCIYGKNNDAERFGYFCGAAMEYLKRFNVDASIVHCHDWPSAPAAWGARGAARAVFTIHNLSYGVDLVGRAMQSCEVATTVSPTYAREISGQPAIGSNLDKLYGIRNGIDAEMWDPENDPFLPMPYDADNVVAGKEAARKELRNRLKLAHVDVPIIAVVTRLVAQKGIHLIKHAAWRTIERGGQFLPLGSRPYHPSDQGIHLIKHAAWRTLERGGQFVLLGSAPDPKVQAEFDALRDTLVKQYNDRTAFVFKYDEPLSHIIYAAADLFLVPSIFEPCGLTQMISMNYGSIPVVRKTGGLVYERGGIGGRRGSSQEACRAETNGFVFDSTDTAGMDSALNRAMSTWYNDRDEFRALQGRVMRAVSEGDCQGIQGVARAGGYVGDSASMDSAVNRVMSTL